MIHNLPNPPKAQEKNELLEIHQDVRMDPYYWLNNPENEEVIQYLQAENTYTEEVLAPVKELQESLFLEMKNRIKEDDSSVPYFNGRDWYYSKYVKGGEYPVYCRKRQHLEANEEILIDGNTLAKGKDYFHIGGLNLSDDDKILALATDDVSRRNYQVRFKNLETGEFYADIIEDTEGGSYAWSADGRYFFYLKRDSQTLLASKVYRHQLGTPTEDDQLVYEESDPQFYMGLYRSKSKKYIFSVSSQQGVASEYRVLNADQPLENFQIFQDRIQGLEYFIEHQNERFVIRCNSNGASNFQLLQCAENHPWDLPNWKPLLAHQTDILLEDFDVFEDFIAIEEKYKGLNQIRILSNANSSAELIQMPEEVYQVGLGQNAYFKSKIIRYNYTSLTSPNSVFDYDVNHKTSVLLKEEIVLGEFNKRNYQSERLWAIGRDNTQIPISLVYKKEFKPNGRNPLLLYAYGSYGHSIDPYFSSSRLSLLDRGFSFAIAHVRGGQEMGRHWYENGKMMKKKNTFYDFIDCSQFLIDQKLVAKDALFAQGGSAGGMLMGGICNMAPELYKGIIAAVPFVDVVTTMLDESIPLTTGEWEEWGNPKNKEHYDYMKSYSPYDNVTAKDYPNILVTTGLHDSQVQYWEPAKWVAKLRKLKTDEHVLLLDCDMKAGHGGASGRFNRFKDIAKEYAFLIGLQQNQ
ncbi:S9 family peptidase [Aquirufa sp. ROCK2-A2]